MVSCPLYLCVQREAGLLLAGGGPSNLQQSVHPGVYVSAKGCVHPVRAAHGLVHSVPHPHPTPCSSKDHSITYSPFVVVRAKKGALLCCRRPGLWGQALLSPCGLDLNLTAHIQGVRGQKEWDMGTMRNIAQIPVCDSTSIYSTLFQRCRSATLNVIRLHKTLSVCGHSKAACPLGDGFPMNLEKET